MLPAPPPGPNEKQTPRKTARFHIGQGVEKNIQERNFGLEGDYELLMAKEQIWDVEKEWEMESDTEMPEGKNLGDTQWVAWEFQVPYNA